MTFKPALAMIAGAAVCTAVALVATPRSNERMARGLHEQAVQAIGDAGGTGVEVSFANSGLPSRHAMLSGGDDLDEGTRAATARAVKRIGGVGGVRWEDGTMLAVSDGAPITPLHCQEDVQALLQARSIRFEESSAEITPASFDLIDEVGNALRPCLGGIIAITGHTDNSGPEPGNLALSLDRARAVREALVERGIPRDGLRARGVGSSTPVEGLEPGDPANRRIDFSVLAKVPLVPTPIDTPGAR